MDHHLHHRAAKRDKPQPLMYRSMRAANDNGATGSPSSPPPLRRPPAAAAVARTAAAATGGTLAVLRTLAEAQLAANDQLTAHVALGVLSVVNVDVHPAC